jgi:hypothetical protein
MFASVSKKSRSSDAIMAKGKLESSEQNPPHWYLVLHKSHMEFSAIEPGLHATGYSNQVSNDRNKNRNK